MGIGYGYDVCKWLNVLVFSDKDDKPQAPSPAVSLLRSTGNVKEPAHLSQSVRHEVPGVVGWSLPFAQFHSKTGPQ